METWITLELSIKIILKDDLYMMFYQNTIGNI